MNGETKGGDIPSDTTHEDDHVEVVILDGGFSSQLSRHVSARVDGDPLWSARFLAEDPKAVVNTHLDFLRAGAEVIITNTYQASIGGFVKYLGVTEEAALQLIVDGVSYAKEAIHLYQAEIKAEEEAFLSNEGSKEIKRAVRYTQGNRFPLIAGSVGPYGASLHDGSEYRGEYVESVSMEEMAQWHRPRITALVKAGVDLLAFETIPAVEEARLLMHMLTKEFPDQKAWLSFSSQDGEKTSHGDNFESAVRECWALGGGQLVAIGVNCLKPSLASSLLPRVNNCGGSSIPLIVYPNSGENWDPEIGWQDRQLCEPVRTHVCKWLNLGVRYIGGCCRLCAEDVAGIKEEVDVWLQGQQALKKMQ